MTRQNRVTPFGDIVAYPERGSWMGNRGRLHDEHGQLTKRRWSSTLWITCRLDFKGRKRQLNSPGHYTELFFLDEATAFAAGHRPCGECRREDYNRFKACWIKGNPEIEVKTIGDLDKKLHSERVGKNRQKLTHGASINDLPNGTLIAIDGQAYLVWDDDLLLWSPGGYQHRIARPVDDKVTVLTPESIVNAFRQGYIPQRWQG
jgi:hypothetical protein